MTIRCSKFLLFLFISLLAVIEARGGNAYQFWPEDPNAQYVVFAAGALSGEGREWEVPIEAKTFRLHFWARIDESVSLEIIGAGGKPQALTEPNISVTNGRDRKSIVIFDPRPGLWKLKLSGSGSFTIGVTTQSELYVCCLSIINTGGPIGHPLPQQVPLRPGNQVMQASLAGFEIQAIEFHLVDEDNRILGPVRLRQNDFSNPYLLIMLVEPPSRPFRLRAQGRDQTGYRFQRLFLPLFQPASEDAAREKPLEQPQTQTGRPAHNPLLLELERSAEAGPYSIVRVGVHDLTDNVLLSENGAPIGLRLKYTLRFPRDGYYTPIPQVYPEQIRTGYTGALSMKVHRFEIAPLPEGPQSAPQLRYLTRAFYKAGQEYSFTVDLIPNYVLFNEQTQTFCIAMRTFSHTSRDRFTSEITNESRMRFRIAIQGTEMDGRQPQLTGLSYVPNSWYSSYMKGGVGECR